MSRATNLEKLVTETDELRRLQKVTKRPPNMHEARALREAEGRVDTLLDQLREVESVTSPPATPATPAT